MFNLMYFRNDNMIFSHLIQFTVEKTTIMYKMYALF